MGSYGQTQTDLAATVSLQNLGDFSLAGGPRIGCDYVAGKFLVGAFADYAFRLKPETTALAGVLKAPGLGNEWSVGGRVGVFPTDATLLYGLAAYTAAQDKAMSMGTLAIPFGGPSGLALGGGIETKIMPSVTVSLEYRHINFDESTNATLGVPISRQEVENQVRVGLNLSFGK
jgi:opacity protein-like surface antigen